MEDTYWWFVGRRKIVRSLLEASGEWRVAGGGWEVTNHESRGTHHPSRTTNHEPRILDVGCGVGGNLTLLSRYGQVVGIDPSPLALSFCRARSHKNLFLADARHLPFADDSFHLVTALDVIEHIKEDVDALFEMRRVLKPQGLLVLTVPAFKCLWSVHDIALAHKRRYTPSELRKAVEAAGLTITKFSFAIFPLLPVVFVFRKLQNLWMKGKEPRTALIELPPPINAALIGLLALEAHLLRHLNLPFGVSLICLARKD